MITLLRTVFALLPVAFLSSCGFSKARTQAEKAVDTFHEQYNSIKYVEIYSAAAPEFKSTFSEAQFMNLMQTVRGKMGKLNSSKENAWRASITIKGTFIKIEYKSQFENSDGVEDFFFVISAGAAKLEGYNVNSPLLPPS